MREHTGETTPKAEKKHFDPLASVRRYEYDIAVYGEVTDATKEQVLNEELSYIAEGLNRVLKTDFTLKRDENGVLNYAASGGARPYKELLDNGIEAAVLASNLDERKSFLITRAMTDHWHGQILTELLPGQSYVWTSPYDQEVEDQYGSDFLSREGFFPERKMGFIYRAHGEEDGNVIIESQTVDNSDDEAFMAVLDHAKTTTNINMSLLVAVYDAVLTRKHGESFVAGKRAKEVKERSGTDVWHFILTQTDLTEYFHSGLEAIAKTNLQDKTDAVKLHTYGVWAAFKERLVRFEERAKISSISAENRQSVHPLPSAADIDQIVFFQQSVQKEVERACQRFIDRGEVLRGCGGSIKISSEAALLEADAQSVFEAIFSESNALDKDNEENETLPEVIRCANQDCRQWVATKDVIKKDSWRCPCCHYEVDVCTGRVINSGKTLGRTV